jgi:hypothetical protein
MLAALFQLLFVRATGGFKSPSIAMSYRLT